VLLRIRLFGGMTILQLQGRAIGMRLPSEVLSALPYLITIVVLILVSRNCLAMALNFPASFAQDISTKGTSWPAQGEQA
jgi:simple sugar transport system permease protein